MGKQIVKNGICTKLLIVIIVINVVLFVLLTVVQIALQKEMLEKKLDARLTLMRTHLISRGKMLSAHMLPQLEHGIAGNNLSPVSEAIKNAVSDDSELIYVILMGTTGTAYIHTIDPTLEQGMLQQREDLLAIQQRQQTVNQYQKDGRSFIELITPVEISEQPWGVLRLGFALDRLDDEIVRTHREMIRYGREIALTSVYIAAILVVFGGLVWYQLVSRFSRKLRHLAKQFIALGQGNFAQTQSSCIDSFDEIGFLYRAFNEMSRNLQASYALLEDSQRHLQQNLNQCSAELATARNQTAAACQSKSEFLAMVSQEIRTPMNAILGMTQLTLKTELTEKQHDYLSKVQSSAYVLLGVINDILDVSKIEAGKLELEQSNFNLEQVLSNLSAMVAVNAEEKGLEMHIRCAKDVPVALVGDPHRLGQVLLRLVGNAIKFTEYGEIIISVAAEQADADSNQQLLRFSVRDTGIGLTREQIAGLIQTFAQGRRLSECHYGDSGIGLIICAHLVEKMGGAIEVTSELGKGSEFSFSIRVKKQKTICKDLAVPEHLKNMKVLVVDDSATSRAILKSYLQSFSFQVILAQSGYEAIELLEKCEAANPFRLILMDWKMPQMDGVATVRSILTNPRVTAPPILIMVSPYGRDEVALQCRDLDVDGFLLKPVAQFTLLETLLTLIDKPQTEGAARMICAVKNQYRSQEKVRGAKILLLEKQLINQQIAIAFLEHAGFVVTIASNAEQVASKIEQQRFDAVLIALQMPATDSLEVIRMIRADALCDDVPIIAMSAHVLPEEKEKYLQLGVNDFVTKPIDEDNLNTTLIKWLSRKMLAKPSN